MSEKLKGRKNCKSENNRLVLPEDSMRTTTERREKPS